MYPIYRDVAHWVIVDETVIHDFTDAENAIYVVNVLIGTLHYMREGIDGKLEDVRTPITRWMTKNQFYNYQIRK